MASPSQKTIVGATTSAHTTSGKLVSILRFNLDFVYMATLRHRLGITMLGAKCEKEKGKL